MHHSDGLLDSRPVAAAAPSRRPAHHPQHRWPLHHAGDDRQPDLRQLRRSARRAGRAEAGAARARQEGREAGRQGEGRSARPSSASATTASRPAARSISCCAASSTGTPRFPGTAAPTARWRTCSATPSTPPAMDWIGNGDHDNGAGREYSWWLTQKFTDAYHVAGPLHADVHLRAQRQLSARPSQLHVRPARRPHPAAAGRAGRRQAASAGIHADDTKMLYRYLKEFDGICASHTSATSMGTDWRDNDPDGRAGRRDLPGRPHVLRDARRPRAPATIPRAARSRPTSPAGIPRASSTSPWTRATASASSRRATTGPRTSPTASSWPRSTTAHGILDGHQEAPLLRRHRQHHPRRPQRRARHGRRIQDERGADAGHQRASARRHWRKVDVLKDSDVVDDVQAGQGGVQGRRGPIRSRRRATHYYYVRVQQDDGELAWGSPMWIEYAK